MVLPKSYHGIMIITTNKRSICNEKELKVYGNYLLDIDGHGTLTEYEYIGNCGKVNIYYGDKHNRPHSMNYLKIESTRPRNIMEFAHFGNSYRKLPPYLCYTIDFHFKYSMNCHKPSEGMKIINNGA